jgi:Flp pilus assembly pilin Flp
MDAMNEMRARGPARRESRRDIASRRTLSCNEKGAATTEYVVLIGLVGIGLAMALVGVGPVLLRNYVATHSIMAAPFP